MSDNDRFLVRYEPIDDCICEMDRTSNSQDQDDRRVVKDNGRWNGTPWNLNCEAKQKKMLKATTNEPTLLVNCQTKKRMCKRERFLCLPLY